MVCSILHGTYNGELVAERATAGQRRYPAGRLNEAPSMGLSGSLRSAGFRLGRLQTGTPARLDAQTIDFSKLETMEGDKDPAPFSFLNRTVDNAVSLQLVLGSLRVL